MMTKFAEGYMGSSWISQGTSLSLGVGRVMSEMTMATLSVALTMDRRGGVPTGFRRAASTAPCSSARPFR